MKPIEKTFIWKLMEALMRWLLMISGVLLIVVITISVFMRYVLKSALFGSEEILALLAIWLYWIGGAYGSYEDSHISADMTGMMIRNERVREIYRMVIRGVTALIAGVFAYWAVFHYGAQIIAAGTRTTGLRIPLVTSRIALTVSFCLMFLYSVYHFVRAVCPLKGGEEEKGGVEE